MEVPPASENDQIAQLASWCTVDVQRHIREYQESLQRTKTYAMKHQVCTVSLECLQSALVAGNDADNTEGEGEVVGAIDVLEKRLQAGLCKVQSNAEELEGMRKVLKEDAEACRTHLQTLMNTLKEIDNTLRLQPFAIPESLSPDTMVAASFRDEPAPVPTMVESDAAEILTEVAGVLCPDVPNHDLRAYPAVGTGPVHPSQDRPNKLELETTNKGDLSTTMLDYHLLEKSKIKPNNPAIKQTKHVLF